MSNSRIAPGTRDIRWIYKRKTLGDVEVWAETREQAVAILQQYGFLTAKVHELVIGRMTRPSPTSLDYEKVESS